MDQEAPSICLVANDLYSLNRCAGIGSYFWRLAHLLARAGWRTHLLYCAKADDREALRGVNSRLAESGIRFLNLDECDCPNDPPLLKPLDEPWFLVRSERVRRVLEGLHRVHCYDLIEFADWQATGFRSVQARRAGSAFTDARLIVKMHGPSDWRREQNGHWKNGIEDSQLDYCERYAFEHADVQLAASESVLTYCRSRGWQVRPDATALADPHPEPLNVIPEAPAGNLCEVVFFGRLELGKGLEPFLDAAVTLADGVAVTFLGNDAWVPAGCLATQWIAERLQGRPHTFLTGFNSEQAVRFLADGNRLAVIASLGDDCPYTLLECGVNRIPFIASHVNNISAMFPDENLRMALLFEPTGRDLTRCLNQYLQAPAEGRQVWCEKVRGLFEAGGNHDRIAEQYARMPAGRPHGVVHADVSSERSRVTIAVPYYNLGPYLPDTLASLAAQTYRDLEVFVINDGSTDAESVCVFAEQRKKHSQFQFIEQPNAGLSATRNRALGLASGEYFLPVDADNITVPEMVERFVSAMQRRPDVAALTCFFLAFDTRDDLDARRFLYAYRPTGGPHFLGSLVNVYGDANAIFRTADLRAVGGYETDSLAGHEDWEAFVKLANAGYRIDVLPEYLFYYRHRSESMLRVTSAYRNQCRVLRQYHRLEHLPLPERIALWDQLCGFNAHLQTVWREYQKELERAKALERELRRTNEHRNDVIRRNLTLQEELADLRARLRYRLVDFLDRQVKRVPLLHPVAKAVAGSARRSLRFFKTM